MSINTDMLRQRMKEKNVGPDQVAAKMGIDRATFYRKMKSGGVKFTVGEIQQIIAVLDLTAAEAVQFFFTRIVA